MYHTTTRCVLFLRLTKNQEIISRPSLSGISKIRFSSVDKRSRLYVIIHGYVSGVKTANWTREMQRKLLSLGSQVVLVDWSRGANTEYFQVNFAKLLLAKLATTRGKQNNFTYIRIRFFLLFFYSPLTNALSSCQ